ncbi:MAG TPA: hypothetical protein VKE74_32585 [Gemmataceae bacterium]|nr:hypothetical protein [Gemmataceae bacterium]
MFVIREAQLEVLRRFAVDGFVDQMVGYVAAEFPRHYEVLGQEGTREFIRRVIRTAAGHGVTTIGAVAVLIELMLQFGERFERSPDRVWANNILAHPTLPDHVKVDAIRDRFVARTGGRVLVPAGNRP